MSKFLTPPSWYDKNGSEINIFDNTTYSSSGSENTAIGTSAIAGRPSGYGAVAVGCQAHAEGNISIAIGSYYEMGGGSLNVEALATGSIAIGGGAKTNADSTDGIAIGRGTTSSKGGIAIGGSVEAAGTSSIAIGNGTRTGTDSNQGIAIGFGATSSKGGIAIGGVAYATGNQIQLGNNNTAYTLNVGDGKGTINGVNLSDVFMPDKKTIKSAASATKIVGRGSSITISNDVATINEPGLYLCQFIYNGSYYNGIIMVYSLDQNTYGICGYHSNTNITNSFVYFNKEQNTIEGYVQGQSTDPTRMSMTRCNRFIDYE